MLVLLFLSSYLTYQENDNVRVSSKSQMRIFYHVGLNVLVYIVKFD